MAFSVGENVGPYRIMEQLGQGGMATVYKAYHAALDRYVALKVLHPAFGEDPNFQARFQREARLIAKLEHPHIVPIYDYAEHEGRPYLVMKYIQGDTLKARLSKGPLTTEEINNVVELVGSALAHAHKQGILHRDIKPSNVLIGVDGQMYLADFGLARIAQAAELTLSADMIMGTPQYISPEQAMGEKNLDEGTDIYSFGVMLYEMVVGQVPFNADTPFSIIHDHIYTPLPMPRAINPSIPEQVQRVLLKALAKVRADRYPDVDSLVKAFQDAWVEAGLPMQGTAITMRPTPLKVASEAALARTVPAPAATVAAKRDQAKGRSLWLLVGAGVLLLVCLAFVALAFRGRGRLLAFLDKPTVPAVPPAATVQQSVPPTLAAPKATAALPTPTVIPAVATALAGVSQNPNDAQAQLGLSLAYWDAGDMRASLLALAKAADLAGVDNTQFFVNAGDQFRGRQAWIATAAMYLRAVKSYGATAKPGADLVTNYHEALYNASVLPDMPSYLPFNDLGRVEQPIALVAQSRHLYYNGNPDQAHQLLNQVKVLKPHMAEASLLEAEMDAAEGKTFEAKQILNILLADLNTPDWVRELAQTLSNKIP